MVRHLKRTGSPWPTVGLLYGEWLAKENARARDCNKEIPASRNCLDWHPELESTQNFIGAYQERFEPPERVWNGKRLNQGDPQRTVIILKESVDDGNYDGNDNR